MNLFVVAVSSRKIVDPAHLEAALRRAVESIPALASEPIHVAISKSGQIGAASVCHRRSTGPRGCRSDSGTELMMFDGLPVMTDGSSHGGAEALALRLAHSTDGVEGMFVSVRVDLREDVVEVTTDPLGNLGVYEMFQHDGTHYVSNSLAAMAWLQGGGEPDPIGVSSFLTLGWYTNGSTPLAGAHVISGGTRLLLSSRRPPQRRRYYSPELLAGGSLPTPDLGTVRDDMVGQMRSAGSHGMPLRLGLTAGQDSRACLALALAGGVDVKPYTEGMVGDLDVDVAVELASEAGLEHELVSRTHNHSTDVANVIRQFIAVGDATSSFSQFADQLGQVDSGDGAPSIKVLGLGGEVSRTNTHPIRGFLASGPPLVDLRSVQESCLARKISVAGGLVRSSAREIVRAELGRWFDDRQREGWGPRWLAETMYVFDSMVRTHQGSRRRTAGTADLFAPLSSRSFVTHALRLAPRRRYAPGVHRALIAACAPTLLRVRAETPYRRTRPSVAPIVSTKAILELAWAQRGGGAQGNAQQIGEASWSEQRALHLEMVESASNSKLYEIIDREFLIQSLHGEHPVTSGTLRALTLIWWFETVASPASPALSAPRI